MLGCPPLSLGMDSPHPGNVLLLPDGTLGLIDYGMVGRLAPAERQAIARVVRRYGLIPTGLRALCPAILPPWSSAAHPELAHERAMSLRRSSDWRRVTRRRWLASTNARATALVGTRGSRIDPRRCTA